jgi:hypothetical protein
MDFEPQGAALAIACPPDLHHGLGSVFLEEMLAELHANFHQQRQMSVTEELLDISAGFEALREGP